MDFFEVTVRNESTGEVRVVKVHSSCWVDAQIEALKTLFKAEDWRNATALQETAALDVA